MRLDELLFCFERLLAEERQAVAAMDAKRVLELSKEKQGLLGRLAAQPRNELKIAAPRLKEINAQIRANCVLLAHARDCVRDAVAAARGTPEGDPTTLRGHRLSVSG